MSTLLQPTSVANKEALLLFKPGSLLRIARAGGLKVEADEIRNKSSWTRIHHYNYKRDFTFPMGLIVLCTKNELNPTLGIRVMQFLYEEKLYTYSGYFLPQDVFEPVVKTD